MAVNLTVTNQDAVLDQQVSPQVKPLLDSLRTLYQTCVGAPQMQAPNKKREMDDNSKKMGQLFWKLNAGDVSEGVVQKLMQLKQALDQGDLNKASSVQVSLTTSDWDECSSWLTALKRLIKARQMLG
ncbi:TPA: hypothetical protein ACH3X1_012813 [Trebouxia sp. C0004]